MTARKQAPLEAYAVDVPPIPQDAPLYFRHTFDARGFAHPGGHVQRLYYCAKCGQIRPWVYGKQQWVEHGMCPSLLDSSFLPEYEVVLYQQVQIQRLNEVAQAASALLVSYEDGRWVRGLDGRIPQRLRDALKDAGVPHLVVWGGKDGR